MGLQPRCRFALVVSITTEVRAACSHSSLGETFGNREIVANAAEAEELDAFDARVAKVVATVRERRYGFDPTKAS